MRDRMRGSGSPKSDHTLPPTQPPITEDQYHVPQEEISATAAIEHMQEPPKAREVTKDEPTDQKPKKQITLSVPSAPSLSRFNFKKIGIVTGLILAGLLLLGGIAFGITKLTSPSQPLPSEIKKQISIVVFYPDGKDTLLVDKKTIKYDKAAKLLSFVGSTNNGTKLTFSQQPTPESFNDIQQAYTALLQKLGTYSSFDSINGRVTLTKPKELNGTQSASMNSKGTLVFVRPSKNMPDDEWKRVFNNLIIVK